jgi:hypothetical protein
MVRSISSSNFQLEVPFKFQYTDRMKNKNTTKIVERYFISLPKNTNGKYEEKFMFNTRNFKTKEQLLKGIKVCQINKSTFKDHDFSKMKIIKKVETKIVEWLEA